MDRNALTEQRRQDVIGLLKSMNIKKSTDGGFDKDDVYDCMQQLCDLYEKSIEELENTYESEIVSLKDKYQKYDDNNELYISLIMEAKKSSNDIINQAKNEVESILDEGKRKVAEQEKQLEQVQISTEAEKKALNEELQAAKDAVEAEKAAMEAELQAEKERLSAMQGRYQQQIGAMESEFMEIKTNILRTAGKIDSLKSKLREEEDARWAVIENENAVDFPTDDISVDNVLPVVETGDVIVDTVKDSNSGIILEAIAKEPEETPVVEVFAEETKAMTEVDEPAEPVQEQPESENVQEVTLEDLMADIEIDLPDLETPEQISEENQEAAQEAVEEISFEGLEDLFKDEK